MEYAVHDVTQGSLNTYCPSDETTYFTDDPSDAVDTLQALYTDGSVWAIYTSAEFGDRWKRHPQLTQLAYDRINLQEA